jgi:hypothetical protein
MSAAIVVGQKCPMCCKYRSPLDFLHLPGNAKHCTSCEQRHLEALEALSTGQFTGECSECGLSYLEIRAQKRCGPAGEMAVHFENGLYRAMCLPCDAAYVPLRMELYGETEFGRQLS